MTDIDSKRKIELAHNIVPADFSGISIFKLLVGEVKIELKYKGDDCEDVKYFLHQYFKNFKTFSGSCDVSIDYWKLPGELGDYRWKPWNIWQHEIDFIKLPGSFDVIIERDFVGKISKDGKNIYCHGPTWSQETCDSLDNIVSYVLGRSLLKYEGVILHAACVVKDDRAFVFFGASGAGKSTLAEHCYRVNKLKVISSDQVIIKFYENQLFAEVMPTTIPEFPLDHPARAVLPVRVSSIVHLTQNSKKGIVFKRLEKIDWLQLFMRELVYRPEFSSGQAILDLSLKIAQYSGIIKAEFSYEKELDFFDDFQKILEGIHE